MSSINKNNTSNNVQINGSNKLDWLQSLLVTTTTPTVTTATTTSNNINENTNDIPKSSFFDSIIPLPSSKESTGTTTTADKITTTIGYLIIPNSNVTIPLTIETLLVVGQSQQQQSLQHRKYCLIVGRQVSIADIRIQHNSISRNHALFYYTSNTNTNTNQSTNTSNNNDKQVVSSLMIHDLGSKYGITINGTIKIQSNTSYVLRNNDTIQFGNVHERIFTIQLSSTTTTTTTNDVGASSTTSSRVPEQQHSEKIPIPIPTPTPTTIIHDESNTDTITNTITTNPTTMIEQNQQLIENAGIGLTERAKRVAEIEAMVNSLNDTTTTTNSTSTIVATTGTSSSKYEKNTIDNDNYINNHDIADIDDTNIDPITKIIIQYKIPVSDRFIIPSETTNTTTKKIISNTISCISYDKSGSKLFIGSTDSYIRMYDFGSMNINSNNTMSTSSIIPDDGHWPISCCYNTTTTTTTTTTTAIDTNNASENTNTMNNRKLLIGTTSSQPNVVSISPSNIISNTDDTISTIKFVRGDMYVTDPTKNFGHTTTITNVQWHPYDSTIAITSSYDGSLRFWDTINGSKHFNLFLTSYMIYTIKSYSGHKTSILYFTIHPNGKELVVCTTCGSIQIWKYNKQHLSNKGKINKTTTIPHRPDRAKYNAYPITAPRTTTKSTKQNTNCSINYVEYNYDGTRIVSRCTSTTSITNTTGSNTHNTTNTVKVWNPQRLSESSHPLFVCQNSMSSLSLNDEYTNCTFSPNGQLLIVPSIQIQIQQQEDHDQSTTNTTGSSSSSTIEIGCINIYNISEEAQQQQQQETKFIAPIIVLPIVSTIPIIVKWHPKINQIFIGCSNGETIILYNEQYSYKGILVPLAKQHQQQSNSSGSTNKYIDALDELLQSRAPPPGTLTGLGNSESTVLPNYRDPDIIATKRRKRNEWKYTTDNNNSNDNNNNETRTTTSTAPERPQSFQHKMSIGQTSGIATTFQQYASDQAASASASTNIGNKKSMQQVAGKDPREALFQYHTEADIIINTSTDDNNTANNNKNSTSRKDLAKFTVEQEEEEKKKRNNR